LTENFFKFLGYAYIDSARTDKEGQEKVVFVFDAQQAIEVAKLKILARDDDFCPKLLKITITECENELN